MSESLIMPKASQVDTALHYRMFVTLLLFSLCWCNFLPTTWQFSCIGQNIIRCRGVVKWFKACQRKAPTWSTDRWILKVIHSFMSIFSLLLSVQSFGIIPISSIFIVLIMFCIFVLFQWFGISSLKPSSSVCPLCLCVLNFNLPLI